MFNNNVFRLINCKKRDITLASIMDKMNSHEEQSNYELLYKENIEIYMSLKLFL
jgi:hypothetical protein